MSTQQQAERELNQAETHKGQPDVVHPFAVAGRVNLLQLSELRESSAGNMGCCSGNASGGVAGPEAEIPVILDSLELAGVQVSGVVATGCGCGPSDDLAPVTFDGEGVLGLDALNVAPTEGCCGKGVDHGDSLVKNHDSGSQEQQPTQSCCGRNDAGLNEPASVSKKQELHREQQVQKKHQAAHDNCGCGSKTVEVGHLTILPLSTKSSSLEGK